MAAILPHPRRTALFLTAAALAAPLVLFAGLASGFDPVRADASRPGIHRNDGFVGTAACRDCHPDHHASWRRTFHSTMTQRPTPAAVLGHFDGQELSFAGGVTRVGEDRNGFWMDVPDPDLGHRRARVDITVGSHRYQQYFERIRSDAGWVRRRLPFLWHIERGIWINVNEVFFRADGSTDHGDGAIWNANCIFCHTTAPEPASIAPDRVSPTDLGLFRSTSAELGIACESCHGPGAHHASRMRSPLRRTLGTEDPFILSPQTLPASRERDICGQCHAQRVPPDPATARTWLEGGPSFRPGNVLTRHITPITRDTPSPLPSQPDLFSRRFYGDGTPRLTAYEWQGIESSACAVDEGLRCTKCHSMHAGDPAGMIRPEMRSNAACTQCHEAIAANVSAHTGHAANGPGSACLACHMPPIVYGVLDIHRSHVIDSPDPRRDGESGRPHACTLCHLDRTLAWSARESTRLFGRLFEAPRQRPDGAPLDLPDGLASLLAGDPIQRAVFAHAFQGAAGVPTERRSVLFAGLALTLGDAYPVVRRFALDALLRWDRETPLELPPVLGGAASQSPESRRARIGTLLEFLADEGADLFQPPGDDALVRSDFSVDLERAVTLLNLQSETPISIGE